MSLVRRLCCCGTPRGCGSRCAATWGLVRTASYTVRWRLSQQGLGITGIKWWVGMLWQPTAALFGGSLVGWGLDGNISEYRKNGSIFKGHRGFKYIKGEMGCIALACITSWCQDLPEVNYVCPIRYIDGRSKTFDIVICSPNVFLVLSFVLA